jgi:hypothetical protein
MLADELTYLERFEEGTHEHGVQKVIKRPYKTLFISMAEQTRFKWTTQK